MHVIHGVWNKVHFHRHLLDWIYMRPCDRDLLFIFCICALVQVAVRAVPYYQDFMVALKKDPSTSDSQVLEDMRTSITLLKANIDEINRFYTQKGQHSEDTV